MIPRRLVAFKQDIRRLDPESQSIRYRPHMWERSTDGDIYFQEDLDFLSLSRQFPVAITRKNVKDLSIEAIRDQSQARKLLLATMLFGYGDTGYGAFRAFGVLNNSQVSNMLQVAIQHVTNGRLTEAYNQFKLKGCGPSFFTKAFYFIGLGAGLDPLPLILDSRVRKSLELLQRDYDVASFKNSAKDYVRYVELANQWSREIGCRADAVEMFLWNPPAAFLDRT